MFVQDGQSDKTILADERDTQRTHDTDPEIRADHRGERAGRCNQSAGGRPHPGRLQEMLDIGGDSSCSTPVSRGDDLLAVEFRDRDMSAGC